MNDPNKTLIPYLWVEENAEVCCTYYGSFNDAVYGAQAAEALHLGWRLDSYIGQISDTEDMQEWRLVVWKQLYADAIIHRDRDECPTKSTSAEQETHRSESRILSALKLTGIRRVLRVIWTGITGRNSKPKDSDRDAAKPAGSTTSGS